MNLDSTRTLLAPVWRKAVRAALILLGLALFIMAEFRIAKMIANDQFFMVVFWHVVAIIAVVIIAHPFWGFAVWLFISRLIALFFVSLGAKYNPDFIMMALIATVLVLRALANKSLSIRKFSAAEACLLLYFIYAYILRDNINVGGLANLAGLLNTWILCPAGLYFIIKNTITEKKHLVWLMWTIIAVGVTWALLGIYEQATGKWWISQVVGSDIALRGDKRSSGPSGHYYLYGNMITLAILMCLHLYSWQKQWFLRLALVVAGATCSLGLYFGYSRAPYVAFVLALFAMLLLTRHTRRMYVSVWAIAALLSIIIVPTALHSDKFRDRLFANTFSARIYITRTSMNMIKANPFFGVGREAYQANVPKYMDYKHLRTADPYTGLTTDYSRAHSELFGKLAELGLVGFALYFGTYLLFMARFVRFRSTLPRNDVAGGDFAVLAVAYTIGVLFTMITDEFGQHMYMYAVIFTLFAMVEKARQFAKHQAVEPEGKN